MESSQKIISTLQNKTKHNGILVNMRKKGNLAFATPWRDPEGIILSEISQKGKDNYYMRLFICGTQKSQTHRNRE